MRKIIKSRDNPKYKCRHKYLDELQNKLKSKRAKILLSFNEHSLKNQFDEQTKSYLQETIIQQEDEQVKRIYFK